MSAGFASVRYQGSAVRYQLVSCHRNSPTPGIRSSPLRLTAPVPPVLPVLPRPVRDDDLECRPRPAGFGEGDRAAVRADDLGGDGEAEAGAAGAGAALKRLEEVAAGARGDARAGVANPDRYVLAVARRAH